jgi:hypothetical protein
MWMWRRTWEHIRNDRRFLIDFWNHGTVCDGCISAGGHGKGGYMYVDWNGAVSPCVFLPYSPLKAQDVFARGGTMTDVWADPFFGAVRQWQTDFQTANRNEIAPCPMRDHHMELRRLLNEYEPDPLDDNARQALLDPEYAAGMADYDRRFGELADPIWESYYNRPVDPTNGRRLAPLPDLKKVP